MTEQLRWWQRGIFYEIVVRSFQDTNGDGSGDLAGVIARLDYLQWLGVDVLWLSPIYRSPLVEAGYDVSDYMGVNAIYGSLHDVDALLDAAHRRGMKVVLDFVPNHTSDRHPWFVEARAARDRPKRDWYLWRDAAPDGAPPNNWVSVFGGSAWAWDAATQQYYYHVFLPQQPDLNWRHPAVQAALHDAMRFWLDRGVDGFRMDAIWHLIKDEHLRDNPPNPAFQPGESPDEAVHSVYTRDRPEVHGLIAAMRRVVDAYDDRLLAGELYLPVERLVTYYGDREPELHLPLNLQLTAQKDWSPGALAEWITAYEQALPPGAWPNWMLSTHDNQRIASRVGAAQARVAALLLLTLRGTVALYYGDEIGMHDGQIPPERVEDPRERRVPGLGRDPGRTPMQWDGRINAGFTTGRPWLPVAADYAAINVAAARRDSRSLLALYRQLIAFRRAEPALVAGMYRTLFHDAQILAYERRSRTRRFLIVLNLRGTPAAYQLPPDVPAGQIVLSTHLDRAHEVAHGTVALRGDEGVLIAPA